MKIKNLINNIKYEHIKLVYDLLNEINMRTKDGHVWFIQIWDQYNDLNRYVDYCMWDDDNYMFVCSICYTTGIGPNVLYPIYLVDDENSCTSMYSCPKIQKINKIKEIIE